MKQLIIKVAILLLAVFLYGCGPSGVVSSRYETPVYERPVRPYPNYVWVDGDWYWRGGNYVYRQGYWSAPRGHRVWHTGTWQQRGSGFYWQRGRWRR